MTAEEATEALSHADEELEDLKEAEKVHHFMSSNNCRRRAGVSGASVTADQISSWQGPPSYEKSPEDIESIKAAIFSSQNTQVLFGHLDSHSLHQVIGAMFLRQAEEGESIIVQGDDGDFFYIVDSGAFDILLQRQVDAPPEHVFTATAQNSFGELALMYNVPRAASVICSKAGGLWALERKCFQMMLITAENSRVKEYTCFLQQIPELKVLNEYECSQLSDLLTAELFDSGEEIMRQSDVGDAVYFLYEGECKALINGDQGELEVRHYLQPGEYFGESAIIDDQRRRATVRAAGDGCVVLKLFREDIEASIGSIQGRMTAMSARRYPSYKAFTPR